MTETYRLRIFYEKSGAALFISGRNLLKIIERTFRRLDVPLKFTEGFSPHPKISFGHPLPLNISGTNESFDVFLREKPAQEEIIRRTRNILPEGIIFRSARLADMNETSITGSETFAEYILETEKEMDPHTLEKIGKIIRAGKSGIFMLIKINNFSHKDLTGLLLDGTVKSISRHILDDKNYNPPHLTPPPQGGRDGRG